jgi:hypothetical protein
MIELETQFEKLSESEAKELHNLLRAKHGNLEAAKRLTGLSSFTINRAKGRLDVTPETAKIIREKLLSGSTSAATA